MGTAFEPAHRNLLAAEVVNGPLCHCPGRQTGSAGLVTTTEAVACYTTEAVQRGLLVVVGLPWGQRPAWGCGCRERGGLGRCQSPSRPGP